MNAKTSKRLGLAIAATLGATPALAHNPGWYGGFSLGQSSATIDDERILNNIMGVTRSSISDDDRDTGYKVFIGRQVNQWLALEAGVFDLGKFGFSAATVPLGTLNGSMKVKGLNLDLVGNFHVTEKLSAFGRVGIQYAETKDSFSGTGVVRVLNTNPSKRAANYKAGLGLEYAFTNAWSMRVEAERYRIDDAIGNKGDIDLASVGLVYRFGAYPPAPPPRVAAAEPARVAPPPPPVAAPVAPAPVAPPPPRPVRVSFSADALFDFDKATLKPAGKQALDKFVSDMKSADTGTIAITGHTDRIGSVPYNQKLSARRAEAVRAYLVSSGIPAGKMSANGAGESNPVTKPGECKGDRTTRGLVACLQPDRRVDVEVSGTK